MPDWDEILTRDGPAVWRTAYRIVGNRADADECVQEAFLHALEISRRETVQHWRALLQRLAAARAVDRLRSRLRRGRHETLADCDALSGPAPLPSKSVEDAELSARRVLARPHAARSADLATAHNASALGFGKATCPPRSAPAGRGRPKGG